MWDERVYTIIIYFLFVMETILAIPLVIDSMIGKTGQEIIYVTLCIHIFLLFFGEVFRIRRMDKEVHVVGIVAFLGSFIPIVAFLLHALVIYFIVRGIMRRRKVGK